MDITATACAEIVGMKRNTVNSRYNDFRHKIMLQVLAETRSESGEFEVNESYFGAKRVRGKQGRGRLEKLRFSGFSSAARKSHRQNRTRLLKRKLNAYNTRTCVRRLYDSLGRPEGLRRLDSERLRPLPSFSQQERICPRKMSCKLNRELLEIRQAQTLQVQRLRFGQVRSTLDGVPVALQPPQRRFIQGTD